MIFNIVARFHERGGNCQKHVAGWIPRGAGTSTDSYWFSPLMRNFAFSPQAAHFPQPCQRQGVAVYYWQTVYIYAYICILHIYVNAKCFDRKLTIVSIYRYRWITLLLAFPLADLCCWSVWGLACLVKYADGHNSSGAVCKCCWCHIHSAALRPPQPVGRWPYDGAACAIRSEILFPATPSPLPLMG